MDGLRENSEALFILTTNRPEALEAALAGRPGRIDQAIEFPLPDEVGRGRLLERYRSGLTLPKMLSKTLVRRTEGTSAALLRRVRRQRNEVGELMGQRVDEACCIDQADALHGIRESLDGNGLVSAMVIMGG